MVHIVRKQPRPESLYKWLDGRLPDNLKVASEVQGYSEEYYVTYKQKGLLPAWNPQRVATIDGLEVNLYHPEWESDFVRLLELYEDYSQESTKLNIYGST